MFPRSFLFVVLILLSLSGVADHKFVVTVVTQGAFTDAGKSIMKEAYSRIGISVEYRQLPGERAIVDTNKGLTDAELFRIDKINLRYPNLVQIPVSYIPDEVSVFSKINVTVDGWQSLTEYSTAVRRGDKYIEDKTRDMERHFVTQDLNLFRMLESDRVQIVVASRWDGLEYIRDIGSTTIKALSPSLVTNPLYHYVHNKHAEIVPLLTDAIQSMHEDGTIKQILEDAEASIFK